MRKFLIWFLLMIGLDQGSKYLARYFELPIIFNTGISFGFGDEMGSYVAILLVVLLTILLAWGLRDYWQNHLALAGIFFGAVFSNLLDRILYGAVLDWLALPVLNLRNNLADIAVVGVLLLKVAPDLFADKKGLADAKDKKHEH